MQKTTQNDAYDNLNAFGAGGTLNVVIETPQNSRVKFKYNHELGIFTIGHVLPLGAVFPFNFGFVPSTQGGDGDPLDVLLLIEGTAYPGCLIPSRLIGVIEADQTTEGQTERNDRLIAVAAASLDYRDITSIHQLPGNFLNEIERFFISYNEARGKEFKPRGRFAADRARQLVEEGLRTRR
jgi:inorganic pyrophosphatase